MTSRDRGHREAESHRGAVTGLSDPALAGRTTELGSTAATWVGVEGVAGVKVGGDLRRLVVVVLLSAWSAATVGVALWVFVVAGRPLREVPAGQPGSVAGVDTLVSDLFPLSWLARGLLLLGLILVGGTWAVAFAGRGFSHQHTPGVTVLFLVAFLAVWNSTSPVTDEWWSRGVLRQVGAHGLLLDSLAQDRRAESAILLVAGFATCGLLAIALRRPARVDVLDEAGTEPLPHP